MMIQPQTTTLRGNIEKVFYAEPKFSAGRSRGSDGQSHSFAGNLFGTEGHQVALVGHWKTHPDCGHRTWKWITIGTTRISSRRSLGGSSTQLPSTANSQAISNGLPNQPLVYRGANREPVSSKGHHEPLNLANIRSFAPVFGKQRGTFILVGKIPIDLGNDMANVDLLTFTGHKLHGPKGIGGLYIRRGIRFKPMMLGGPHENGMRAGTENVPCIMGLAQAFRLSNQSQAGVQRIRDRLQALIEEHMPWIEIVAKGAPRLDNTLFIALKKMDSDTLLHLLEQDGILASNGSACSSGSLEGSHVLKAMGKPYNLANGAIRFSFSRYNEPEDAERIFESLRKADQRF